MWAIVAGILSGVSSGLLSGVLGTIIAHKFAVGRAKQEREDTVAAHLAALQGEMTFNVLLAEKPILGDTKVPLAEQWDKG